MLSDVIPPLNSMYGERGVITRTASHVCGPGSTGHMHYLPDFSLPAAFRDGHNHHSLTSEEAEAQRCNVSAEDHRAPGQQNVLHPLLPVLCGETGSVSSPRGCAHIAVPHWASGSNL